MCQSLKIKNYYYDEEFLKKEGKNNSPDVMVYPFHETAVVLGRGSDPELELYVDAIHEDGIAVYRRKGGGCSVVLDPGNVILAFSFSNRKNFSIHQLFALCSKHVIKTLQQCELPKIEQKGISDLAIGNQKIGGACLYLSKQTVLYSITLLVDANIDSIEKYLRYPPREPDYRKGRSHRDFVTTLLHVNPSLDYQEILTALKAETKPISL